MSLGNIFGASLDVTGNVLGDVFAGNFIAATNTNVHAALLGRDGGNGSLVQWAQDGVPCGTIAVFGGVVSYNAFTGSHYGWIDAQQPPIDRGTLVSMTGSNRRSDAHATSEIIYGIAPSTSANDPACLGAYLGVEETTLPAGDDNPHLVMAVGNGEMWVIDAGGDLQPGDLLISSDVAGCAMKDDPGRFPVSYVIARVAEPIVWNNVTTGDDGVKRALVSVLFESFTRSNSHTGEIASLRQENAALRQAMDDIAARLAALENR